MASYRRRQPETTVLYRVVHAHLDELIARADARYEFGYPAHIEKTYRAYLECGLLRNGFARVVCEACGNEMLVAFASAAATKLAAIGENLTIYDNDELTALDLGKVGSVGRWLSIEDNSVLENLDLRRLVSIGSNLTLLNNAALPDLDGFAALDTTIDSLTIAGNDALATSDGLSGITAVAEYLTIEDNAALLSLDGLSALTTTRVLDIVNNDSLTSITGLSALGPVVDRLWINDNAALASLEGLDGIECVFGELGIHDNDTLTDLQGLSGLRWAPALHISGLDNLVTLDGLDSLSTPGCEGVYDEPVEILLDSNPSLTSLEALAGITAFNWLSLWNNDALVSLDGLDAVEFVGVIEVWGNDALVNLDALGAVTWCGGMIFIDNTALPTCEATEFRDRLIARELRRPGRYLRQRRHGHLRLGSVRSK